jgi:hypothetical protein
MPHGYATEAVSANGRRSLKMRLPFPIAFGLTNTGVGETIAIVEIGNESWRVKNRA